MYVSKITLTHVFVPWSYSWYGPVRSDRVPWGTCWSLRLTLSTELTAAVHSVDRTTSRCWSQTSGVWSTPTCKHKHKHAEVKVRSYCARQRVLHIHGPTNHSVLAKFTLS